MKHIANQLPVHTAPDTCWEHITHALDVEQSIQKGMSELPVYEAPDVALDSLLQTNKVKSIRPTRRWMTIAASIAFLAICAYWLRPSQQIQFHQIAYQPTEMPPAIDRQQWIDQLDNQCQQYAWICQQPDVQALRHELNELNAAEINLRAAIHPYDTDTYLQKQLVKIELERDEIIRDLMLQLHL